MIADSFDEIYEQLLRRVVESPTYETECRLGGMRECLNLMFTVTNPADYLVTSKTRNFRHGFAKKFYEWLKAGETDISLLYGDNPNAQNYAHGSELPKNFSSAYGPRIMRQLPAVIQTLAEKPGSRRCVIHVLEEPDKIILNLETKAEYPCTNSIQFFIRDRELHMTVMMRSNNVVTTICYDMYNFCNLMLDVLEELRLNYDPRLGLGTYTHFMASAHVLNKELELAENILLDYEV